MRRFLVHFGASIVGLMYTILSFFLLTIISSAWCKMVAILLFLLGFSAVFSVMKNASRQNKSIWITLLTVITVSFMLLIVPWFVRS
jgi:hypothetical protein